MIKLEGHGFKSHPGQSFPLSLCGPISICRANAHMVYGLKHQHFTSHSITTIQGYTRLYGVIQAYTQPNKRENVVNEGTQNYH